MASLSVPCLERLVKCTWDQHDISGGSCSNGPLDGAEQRPEILLKFSHKPYSILLSDIAACRSFVNFEVWKTDRDSELSRFGHWMMTPVSLAGRVVWRSTRDAGIEMLRS